MNYFAQILFTVILLAASSAQAGMPAMPEIPVTLPDEVKEPLIAKRQPLALRKLELIDEGETITRECTKIEKGSARHQTCLTRLGEFNAKVEALRVPMNKLADEIDVAVEQYGQPGKSLPAFSIPNIDFRGEFYLVTADGRKLIGKNAANVPIDKSVTAITGPDGWARLTLPDGTHFTIGANSNMVLDDFVYDPKPGMGKIMANLLRGTFRFVTGKVSHGLSDSLKVKIYAFAVGIRGTDFECSVSSDGSGFVKLFSGEIVLSSKDSNEVIALKAGEMVTFTPDKISSPFKIPGEV